MEHQQKPQDKFGTRFLKGLRVLAYAIVFIMMIAVFYSGSQKIQVGNSQSSTITCSNGQTFSFASIGIDASNYGPYSSQLLYSDNYRVNNTCGAANTAKYSLAYDTRPSDPNATWTAFAILGIGTIIIEFIYRLLAYIGGAKV